MCHAPFLCPAAGNLGIGCEGQKQAAADACQKDVGSEFILIASPYDRPWTAWHVGIGTGIGSVQLYAKVHAQVCQGILVFIALGIAWKGYLKGNFTCRAGSEGIKEEPASTLTKVNAIDSLMEAFASLALVLAADGVAVEKGSASVRSLVYQFIGVSAAAGVLVVTAVF